MVDLKVTAYHRCASGTRTLPQVPDRLPDAGPDGRVSAVDPRWLPRRLDGYRNPLQTEEGPGKNRKLEYFVCGWDNVTTSKNTTRLRELPFHSKNRN